MAHRVSAGGSYRLDKRFPPPVGRLAIATGATTRAAFRQAEACVLRIAERGRLDVLAALKARLVTVPQVLDADRRDSLDELLASLTPRPEDAPLWPAVEAWLGPAEDREPTPERYGNSLSKLKQRGVLGPDAIVSDLARVDWHTLNRQWPGSAADWNHLRRAVSRFLTVHLGDVYHELRRDVLGRDPKHPSFPKRAELERVPDIDAALFWRIVEAAREDVRPAFVCIVALGLRLGEYERLERHHLHPITKTVSIPGTKTADSAAVLYVDPELWPWVVAAVPAPLGRKGLRGQWKRALGAVEADPGLRLHDLRHLTAQVLTNVGRSEAAVQTTMRHATASMTRRYAKQRDKGENAAALARGLGVPQSVPQPNLAVEGGRR